MYKRSILEVNKLYPEKFPLEVFTYELFEFAWNTISARAFGRRLPWSALGNLTIPALPLSVYC